jgi:hypothetical protein
MSVVAHATLGVRLAAACPSDRPPGWRAINLGGDLPGTLELAAVGVGGASSINVGRALRFEDVLRTAGAAASIVAIWELAVFERRWGETGKFATDLHARNTHQKRRLAVGIGGAWLSRHLCGLVLLTGASANRVRELRAGLPLAPAVFARRTVLVEDAGCLRGLGVVTSARKNESARPDPQHNPARQAQSSHGCKLLTAGE